MDKDLLNLEKQIYTQVNTNMSLLLKSIADSQNMVTDLNSITVEKDKIISQLEKDNEQLKISNDLLSSDIKKKDELLAQSNKDIELLKDLKIDSLKLANLIEEEQRKTEELEEEKNDYISKKDRLESENESLRIKLKEETDAKIKLKQDLDATTVDFREEIQKLKKENKSQADKIETLNDTVETKSVAIKTLQDDVNELDQVINDKDKKIAELSDELLKLEGSDNKDELNRELENLKSKIDSLKADLVWLINYAKSTDEKVVAFFKGNKDMLQSHNEWLTSYAKNDEYKKFFGEDSGYRKTNHVVDSLEENNKTAENEIEKVKGKGIQRRIV